MKQRTGKIYQVTLSIFQKDKIFLSLNLNTDGAPIGKSNTFSLWPIFATITELKPSLRNLS